MYGATRQVCSTTNCFLIEYIVCNNVLNVTLITVLLQPAVKQNRSKAFDIVRYIKPFCSQPDIR